MKPKEALAKIGAALSFIVFIGGGGFLATSGYRTDNYGRLGVGLGAVAIGIFLTAFCVTYIAYTDGNKDFKEWSLSLSLKAALTFAFFVALLIFGGISIVLWVSDGFWQLGIAGIAAIVFMIVFAVEWSIRWQTRSVKQVLADPDAIELTGRITSVDGHFRMEFFGKTKVFFYRYGISASDVSSQTFLRGGNPLSKKLVAGDKVKIKMNPEKTQYCAIIEKIEE